MNAPQFAQGYVTKQFQNLTNMENVSHNVATHVGKNIVKFFRQSEIMKGLVYLGSLIRSYTDNEIPRAKQKSIRKKINPLKICELCLSDYKHQTRSGLMLCDKCHKEVLKENEK